MRQINKQIRRQANADEPSAAQVLVAENLASSLLGTSAATSGGAAHALAQATGTGKTLDLPLAAVILGAYVLVAASISARCSSVETW